MARGEEFPFAAREGPAVHVVDHGDGGLVDPDAGQGLRVIKRGNRVADTDVLHAGDGDDIAGLDPIDGLLLESVEGIEGREFYARDILVRAAEGVGPVHFKGAVHHSSEADLAHVGIVIQVCHEKLRDLVVIALRSRDVGDNRLEEGQQGVGVVPRFPMGNAESGVRVEDGELDLLLAGVEIDEEIVDLAEDGLDAGISPVDLVDDKDHGQRLLQGLLQDEARLGQGPLAGVDQKDRPVDEVEAPLHLAAEIGVSRRVHDVDLGCAVPDGGVLRHDRDAALALEIHGVHDALHELLVGPEDAALPEHAVHERCLAVVDVGDDGDISDAFFTHDPAFFFPYRTAAGGFDDPPEKKHLDLHRGAHHQKTTRPVRVWWQTISNCVSPNSYCTLPVR